MEKQPDSNEFIGYKNTILSQVFTLNAIITLLEKKGLVTKREVIEEIKKLSEKAPVSV